ncbi:MAG: oligoendopeptidase F [Saccharofermentanales bacterium]
MSNETKSRIEIPQQYKWRLTDIFVSDDAWEIGMTDLAAAAAKIEGFRGRLGESSAVLLQALEAYQNGLVNVMELYTYAKMSKDLDNSNPLYQGMFDRIISEYYKLSSLTAFIEPELAKIDENLLKEWLKNEPELDQFSHFLDNLLRNKKHILSEKEEKLLSGIGPIIEGVEESFSMMNNLELDFGEVVMDNGEKVKLTHGKFGALREDPSRQVRSQAYEKLHSAYRSFGNTIAAIYTTSVKSDVFMSRTREFGSCMGKAMFADQLPELIYTNLIDAIHDRLPSFYRYLELRKKVLGHDELHIYDTSVPIVSESGRQYDFDESAEILRKGLAPLGEQYLKDLETILVGNSIDVYETHGKTSGAYAWGTYRSHPYMLLNWSGKLNDVFTFAHEAGHCMHSYYSVKNQTYLNSHYPIFLAEIASTVNENVLHGYLLQKCDTSTREGIIEKAGLINYYLEGVKSTVIRQTMFAEFELKVHAMAEEGKPLTAEVLTDTYGALLRLYFGENVVIDDYMNWEWARIPHFYNSFYVYKYATGFCAAAKISQQLFSDKEAPARYNRFLSSGGSHYPADILKIMDIDMTQPDAVNATMALFDERVTELEALLALI